MHAWRPRIRTPRPSAARQCACVAQLQLPNKGVVAVSVAGSAAELRSAAYLRAESFYTYPEGRSEFAARAHRRMKGDHEWAELQSKVDGTHAQYKGMRVTCFIATIPDLQGDPLAEQVRVELEPSTKLPAEGGAPPQLVVGTLDLNRGAVLPSEELLGALPKVEASKRRGYLSNVCVSRAARRQGVALRLIQAAEAAAAAAGIQHLYVHVVHDNAPAVALYTGRAGFELESQESAATARSLNRPRRLLLHKAVVML